MMSSAMINALYAIGGFIVGGYVSFRYKVWLYKRTKFIDACIEFKAAFTEMLLFIDIKNDPKPISEMINAQERIYAFIVRDIPIEERAYIKFCGFLKKRKRKKFEKVWEEYTNPGNNNLSEIMNRVLKYRTKTLKEEVKIRADVRKMIKDILRFAEYE